LALRWFILHIEKVFQTSKLVTHVDAVKLIRKVKGIKNAQQHHRDFGDYLAGLRFRFKVKRNFIKLLDGMGGS
jgi:hypothetical protein